MMSPTPRSYIKPLTVRQRIQREQPLGLPGINMGYNELPFPPSPLVRSAIEETMGRVNSYGNPTCTDLRSALSRIHDLPVDSIICGNGSEELLDVIGRCFARPGDEILISAFGYIQFPIVANRVGANLVKAPETDYSTNVDAILAGVSDKTRIVFLANPNNPTGTMCSVEELEQLAQQLPGHIVLTIDLAYGEFVGADYCPAVHSLAKRFDNVIVTRTFSKAYGLAGLRVGWCVASEAVIPALYAGRGMGTVNAVAQAAALAALEQPETVADQIASIIAERERVTGACSAMGLHVVASSTNFLMVGEPDDDGQRADALAEHLFDTAGIIVNRTREAGLERFIRFSLSLPEHNDLLIEGIRSFIEAAPQNEPA
ncbi:MAG: aminotransferase class I/II-fold pyridoxal phosphate-dependent enzyme [Hyphomicrobiales bacterium]|nr:aminotransferase class I/II-fold pyridoxal phosphate-dependent enzyme [Hyphomicrobiales bacterium]